MKEFIESIISNPWIGVIGIAVGLAGILVTIWVATKQKKYPTKLCYYSIKTINLYKSISIPFSKINITYENNRIDKNIIFTSGFLICEGQRDISNNTEPIQIVLPEGNKWLDMKASSQIPSLNSDLSISYNENLAELKFSKLKRGEAIFLQSIMESDNSEDSTLDSISFSHRIDNTEQKIRKKNGASISNTKSPYSNPFYILILQILTVISILTLIVSSIYNLYRGRFDQDTCTLLILYSIMSFLMLKFCIQLTKNKRIRTINNIQ